MTFVNWVRGRAATTGLHTKMTSLESCHINFRLHPSEWSSFRAHHFT